MGGRRAADHRARVLGDLGRPESRAAGVASENGTAGDLEQALELRGSGDGTWIAHADPHYESMNGMFGGWTAAVALRAVCDAVDGEAAPSALTVNFVGKVEPGRDILIQTRRVGGGRSVSYWQSELTVGRRHACGRVGCAHRATRDRRTPRGDDARRPRSRHARGDVPRPRTVGRAIPVRPIFGLPPHNRESTYSTVGCVRRAVGSVDHLQLAFLADHRAPRSFFWSDGPRPSSTLTLSVYFHATDSELAAVGDDEILSEAFGTRGAQSTSEEHLRLWSRQGALLATSVQMGWYR